MGWLVMIAMLGGALKRRRSISTTYGAVNFSHRIPHILYPFVLIKVMRTGTMRSCDRILLRDNEERKKQSEKEHLAKNVIFLALSFYFFVDIPISCTYSFTFIYVKNIL